MADSDEKARLRKKEYMRKWHLEHKEEQSIKRHEYRLKNINEVKARDKAYYDKNRKRISEYRKSRSPRSTKDWRPIIQKVKEELAKFRKLGIKPTLRTMHYRLYSLGVFPNTTYYYNKLSRNTTKAREYEIRGIEEKDRYFETLPIDCFADDTREATRYVSELSYWEPEDIIEDKIDDLENFENHYERHIPTWVNQPHYVEVWIEKKAMLGTFKEIVGSRADIVPFGGFHSVPYLWDNANLLKDTQKLEYEDDDGNKYKKKIHILYFGDFDPTGEVIEEVLRERLQDYGAYDIDFQRIGVTYNQMKKFKLPEKLDPKTYNKIKDKDSNAGRFIKKYGKLYQIEIDALPAKKPNQFRKMVIDNIDKYYDQKIYEKVSKKYSPENIRKLVKEKIHDKFD